MKFTIRKFAVVAGVGGVLLLAILVLQLLRLQQHYQHVQELKAEVRELEEGSRRGLSDQRVIQENSEEIELLTGAFVTSDSVVTLLSEVKLLAVASAVDLTISGLEDRAIAEEVEGLFVTIQTRGALEETLLFFENLEELPYVYWIEEMSMFPQEEAGEVVWISSFNLLFVWGDSIENNE